MIFRQWKQVLDGTKTQTRRPCKGEDEEYTWCTPTVDDGLVTGHRILEVCVVGAKKNYLRWAVGKTYAVQPGRGKKAVGRIRITKIRRQELQGIMPLDIMAEGIEPIRVTPNRFMAEVRLEDFAQLWDCIYRKPYRWEDNPDVWVLEFELVKGSES